MLVPAAATALGIAVAIGAGLGTGLVVWLLGIGVAVGLESPFALAGALLGVRSLTDAFRGRIPIVGGHGVTAQQLWGVGAIVCIGLLLGKASAVTRRRVAVVGALVALPGMTGAVLGPVPGGALRSWFWIVLAAVAFVVAREVASRIGFAGMAWVMVVPALATIALTIVHGFGHSYTPLHGGRILQATAGFVSPHTLAFASVPLVAWMCALALIVTDPRQRLFATSVAAALAVIVVLTTIRTGQVALVIVLIGVAVALLSRQRTERAARRIRVLIGAGAAALVAGAVADPSVRTRWLHVFDSGQAHGLQWSGSGRGFLWHQALLDFTHSPLLRKLFGSGWGASQVMTQRRYGTPFSAHSDVLELLVTVGVVGLVLLLVLAVAPAIEFLSLRSRLRRARADWFWLFVVTCTVGFASMSVLTGLISYTNGAVSAALFAGSALAVAGSPPALELVGEPVERAGALLRRAVRALRALPRAGAAELAPSDGIAPDAGLAAPRAAAASRLWMRGLVLGVVLVIAIAAALLFVWTSHPRQRASRTSLPGVVQRSIYLGAPPAAIARRLHATWTLAERISGAGFPGAAALERAATKAQLPLEISRTGRKAAPGVPVLDARRSGRRELVLYATAADGTVWQLAAARGGEPTFARAGTYDAAVLADGPIGYWRLEEPAGQLAADASGFGATALYHGQILRSVGGPTGLSDHAVAFRHTGYVSLRLPRISLRRGAATTVEFWIAPTKQDLLALEMPFGFRYYDLYLGLGGIGFNTGNSDLYGAAVPGLARGWHYVVAIFRNGSVRRNALYVDGRRLRLRQRIGVSVPQHVSRDAHVSGWPPYAGKELYGRVDDVAVYPYALNPARVAAHFKAVPP